MVVRCYVRCDLRRIFGGQAQASPSRTLCPTSLRSTWWRAELGSRYAGCRRQEGCLVVVSCKTLVDNRTAANSGSLQATCPSAACLYMVAKYLRRDMGAVRCIFFVRRSLGKRCPHRAFRPNGWFVGCQAAISLLCSCRFRAAFPAVTNPTRRQSMTTDGIVGP